MKCNICPRECDIDREKSKGFCGMGEKPVVARASLHMWEEPCISGTRGSGTVFFSGCNLKCIFCQNHEISHGGIGKEMSIMELAGIFLSLQDKGAHNINLVTPSHFVPAIKEALDLARAAWETEGHEGRRERPEYEGWRDKSSVPLAFVPVQRTCPSVPPFPATFVPPVSVQRGGQSNCPAAPVPNFVTQPRPLDIPVVYNTNGYDSLNSLKMLDGSIDIYLPDLKYISPEVSKEYSGAKDYFDKASKAILEMHRQVGMSEFDESGLMTRGMIIRHLVLPGHTAETLRVLEWISENLPKDINVSLMSQYTPCYKACGHPVLGRGLTRYEYEKVTYKFAKLGLNGFVQDRESASEQYIPDFNQE
jgi:uncharacterized Fe-S radical SAM superfamily protein PflX